MTIKTIYQGDLHTECTHLQSGSIIHTDAPTDNHGKGENFSPTDLLATAAGTCAITFMAIQARDEGVDIKGSEVEITKIMSKTLPRKIEKIQITLHMKTNISITEDQKIKFENYALNCPVMLSLNQEVGKDIEFNWN